MSKKLQPNIHQVAKEAGVSPATVSRVLRNRDIVSEDTAQKVEKAVSKLGYRNNNIVPSAVNKSTATIAAVLPDVTNPFFSSVLGGIVHTARNHRIQTVICDSQNNIDLENEYLHEILSMAPDGLILSPVAAESTMIDRILQANINVIFADRIITAADSVSRVISDDYQGAYQIIKYLINIGHRDILYLGTYKGASTELDRLNGYRAALADNGIEVREELIAEKQLNVATVQDKINELLDTGIKFSAVFGADDPTAIEAMKTLTARKLRVPEDISVAGYGDMIFVNQCELTTVAVPSYEIGRNAMILLTDLIENRVSSYQEVILKPSIVIRSSCAPV